MSCTFRQLSLSPEPKDSFSPLRKSFQCFDLSKDYELTPSNSCSTSRPESCDTNTSTDNFYEEDATSANNSCDNESDETCKRTTVVTFCESPTLVLHTANKKPHRPTQFSQKVFLNPYGPPLYQHKRPPASHFANMKPLETASNGEAAGNLGGWSKSFTKKKAKRKKRMVQLTASGNTITTTKQSSGINNNKENDEGGAASPKVTASIFEAATVGQHRGQRGHRATSLPYRIKSFRIKCVANNSTISAALHKDAPSVGANKSGDEVNNAAENIENIVPEICLSGYVSMWDFGLQASKSHCKEFICNGFTCPLI